MNVGVRELKAKLSEYVALAAAGQRVTVTDRGRPVAELAPLAHPTTLDRGIDEGWVEPARQTALGEAPLFDSAVSVLSMLDEDRDN